MMTGQLDKVLLLLAACIIRGSPRILASFGGAVVAFQPPVARRNRIFLPSSVLLYNSVVHHVEHHTINNCMSCIEVKISLPLIGTVTLLEATAETQEVLVDLAIEDDVENLPSGDPYGAVLWPASITIASHLLEQQDLLLRGQRILELGTGTGLISIAAAMGGAKSVLATDYEPIPLAILEYAARHLNGIDAGTDDTSSVLETRLLDFCDSESPLPPADVVVAADVMYEPKTGKALAHRVLEALAAGCRVLIGDSPGRPGRPAFLSELHTLGLNDATFTDRVGTTVTGARHELICGKTSRTVTPQPEDLIVAVMELHPSDYPDAVAAFIANTKMRVI
jgi:predicted nicotinamide N-methyase